MYHDHVMLFKRNNSRKLLNKQKNTLSNYLHLVSFLITDPYTIFSRIEDKLIYFSELTSAIRSKTPTDLYRSFRKIYIFFPFGILRCV